MYSVATEETLRVMGGHADLVTGVQLNPHNHMQVRGGGGGGGRRSGSRGCWGCFCPPSAGLTCLCGGCPGCWGGWLEIENELEANIARLS